MFGYGYSVAENGRKVHATIDCYFQYLYAYIDFSLRRYRIDAFTVKFRPRKF